MAKKKKSYKRKTRKPVDESVKVVKTANEVVGEKKKVSPTISRTKSGSINASMDDGMLFGKDNFMLLGLAALLMVIGLALMTGGHQPQNEWDASEVYSFRRTGLAPMVILSSLIVGLYSIFKKRTDQ